MADFALGWNRDKEDRDFLQFQGRAFKASANPLKPLPRFSARSIIKMRSQGSRNSCVGHGLANCGAACAWIDSEGKIKPEYSRWGAYIWAQQMGGMGGRDNGATISGAIKAASQLGFVDETLWPYPADNQKYSQREPPGAKAAAKPFVVLKHTPMQSADQCLEWMQQGKGPILGGINWTDRLANAGGRITLNDARGRSIGGHCVFWFGWDENGNMDMGNSHTVQWGDSAWSLCDYEFMDYQCRNGELHGLSDLLSIESSRPVIADPGEGY